MDQDISSAADSFALAKIKAQDYRNEVVGKNAAAAKLAADTAAGYVGLDAQEAAQFKRELMLAAFGKYMTTGTGVGQTAIDDAIKDAFRAKAAYDAFVGAFGL